MAQNIYDDPGFFAGYGQLIRSRKGLDGAAEWPAIRAMLPPMAGLDVVDLGCGFGWFARWARDQGAAHILALDVSENMLTRARAEGTDSIIYRRGDLDHLTLPPKSFDLAYSSLAFHYVSDAARLFAAIHASLRPGAHLVFSTEHPIYMAPTNPAWSEDSEGRRIWPLDRYLVEGPRRTDWLASHLPGGVEKHHRLIGTTLTLLIRAGFTLTHIEEFCPTPEQIADRPDLAAEIDRPMFLLVSAAR